MAVVTRPELSSFLNGDNQGAESKVSAGAVKGVTLLVQLSYVSRSGRGKRKHKGRHYSTLQTLAPLDQGSS